MRSDPYRPSGALNRGPTGRLQEGSTSTAAWFAVWIVIAGLLIFWGVAIWFAAGVMDALPS